MTEVLLRERNGPLLTLTLNRPARKNALNPELVRALGAALASLEEDPTIRAVVLSGSGEAFCSGADLAEILSVPVSEREALLDAFQSLVRGIVYARVPVVAQIHGAAAGFGVDLALACDFRIASTISFFQPSFVAIGLMPDGGSTHILPHIVGYSKAAEMLLLGERQDAATLREYGVLQSVVPVEALEATTGELTERLTLSAPLALTSIKSALAEGRRDGLEAALAREKSRQLELLASKDFAEGVRAFLEKRPPAFHGH